jgi:hypothetical protein
MRRPKGTGSVFQRPDSDVWWIKYSRNGKPYRESTKTTDKRKADRLLKIRRASALGGSTPPPGTIKNKSASTPEQVGRSHFGVI